MIEDRPTVTIELQDSAENPQADDRSTTTIAIEDRPTAELTLEDWA